MIPTTQNSTEDRRGALPLCGGALALAGLMLASCSPSESTQAVDVEPAQNLLLVTFDTTRADRLGCYGHAGASTPVLDELAREGVLFEQCIAPSPITLPSHATILTGLQPYSHGVRNNGTHYLSPAVDTLAERLDEMGFATGAVVSSFVLDSRFGLDQGFDEYDDDLSGSAALGDFGYRETIAEDGVRRAMRWLDGLGGERWFLWLHLFDPHSNYSAPEPYGSRFHDEPYDGELAYTDAMLGKLLDHLQARGQLAQTLVVMTADHGESLGEHDEDTHGVFIHDATTRVPLILNHASLARGTRIASVVGSTDIAPTVLQLLGAAPKGLLDGRSLAPLALGGRADDLERAAYSESMLPYYNFGWAELRALRSKDTRFVRAPTEELYDLASDPGELENLAQAQPERLGEWSARLTASLPSEEVNSLAGNPDDLDPEVIDSLAALGYTFSAERKANEPQRSDPKDALQLVTRCHEAEALLAQGKSAEAEALYRQVIAANPGALMVRNALADLLARSERLQASLDVQLGSVGLPGFNSMNAISIADLRFKLGLQGWDESLELAKQLDPRDPLPWVREAQYGLMPADPAGAIALCQKALELDERCALAWIGIADAETSRRNANAAAAAARKATEADPSLFRAWFILGSMSAAQKQHDQAAEALQRAKDLEPGDVQTRIGLAMVLGSLGRTHEAEVELRAAYKLDPARVEQLAARNAKVAGLLKTVR